MPIINTLQYRNSKQKGYPGIFIEEQLNTNKNEHCYLSPTANNI